MRQTLLPLLVLLIAVHSFTVEAQPPALPREYLEPRRQLGDRVAICIWSDHDLYDFDRALATTISELLLLSLHLVEKQQGQKVGVDLWEEVYIALHTECDAFVGFRLVPDSLPDWVQISRDYLSFGYSLLVAGTAANGIYDLPEEARIGSPLNTAFDYGFINYLTVTATDRLLRVPYYGTDAAIQNVLDGNLDGAFVWTPFALAALSTDTDIGQLSLVNIEPIPDNLVKLGIIVKAQDDHLRTVLDAAIGALIEGGEIALLAEDYLFVTVDP